MAGHPLRKKIADTEQRVTTLHSEKQKLRRKYGTGLKELTEALDRLKGKKSHEQQTVNGIPITEAVADTRAWERILKNLEREEKKLAELIAQLFQ